MTRKVLLTAAIFLGLGLGFAPLASAAPHHHSLLHPSAASTKVHIPITPTSPIPPGLAPSQVAGLQKIQAALAKAANPPRFVPTPPSSVTAQDVINKLLAKDGLPPLS
jgi:hypothetical protein